MNTIDITPIVNAALALIGAGVSVFLIPWLKKQTTEAQRKELTAWVKIGVAAAEQLYVGQGRGEENTFSTENWNRPEEEVQALMSLLVSAIHRDNETLF